MDKIYSAISQGRTVVTPTKRMAREVQVAYNRQQSEKRQAVWPTPKILPWQAWLGVLHQDLSWTAEGAAGHRLLSPVQSRLLWEGVLNESGLLPGHLAASTLVKDVMKAWRLAMEYQLSVDPGSQAANDNCRAFVVWGRRYRQRLGHRGWLDPYEFPATLAAWVGQRGYFGPALSIVTTEAMPPSWTSLLEVIREQGGDIELLASNTQRARATMSRAENPEAEWRNAARWARYRMEGQPGVRLGIIIDDLDRQRPRVLQIFTEELCPGAALCGLEGVRTPFHLSMGQRLLDLPMVYQAMALLKWLSGEHGFEVAGRVLRAPYLAPTREAFLHRACLDAELRRQGMLFVAPASVLELACRAEGIEGEFSRTLAALIELSGTQMTNALPSAWAERFSAWLSAMAWPGFQALDSGAYQALTAWNELLSEFSSMDPVTGSLHASLAVRQLGRLASEKIFQPEARDVPVQILDLREAQGLAFDAVWVCGWHDEAWPQASSPSPFLPLSEQRTHHMPGSSAEIRYQEALAAREKLLALAPECLFSWPQAEDGRPLRPSGLIAQLPEADLKLETRESFHQCIRRHRSLEPRPPAELPEIVAGARVRGGVQVLEQQSSCPFRAFAEHRMGATCLETPGPGLDPRQRGLCIHRSMEGIWQGVRSQADLLALDDTDLSSVIETAVDRGFDAARINAQGAWRNRLLELEKVRARRLVADLMEAEKRRPEFIVKEQEIGLGSELGGLVFKIRPDRIDLLSDGRELLLDYKTGSVNPREWLYLRIKSVQLPLYVLASPGKTRAAYFATLKAGDVGFHGMQADEDMMPADRSVCENVKWSGRDGYASWEDMLLDWQRKLEQLATAFRESDIRVDPDRDACLYCHLGTLCRVAERQEVHEDE